MSSFSVLRSQVNEFHKKREHHQAKADEHNDAIFLIAVVVAGTADTVSLLAPFTGPGAIVLPFASGLGTFFLNGFFWTYRRDTLNIIDHLILGALTVNEFMPLSSALPTAVANILYRWDKSRQAAAYDKEEADKNDQLEKKERARLMRVQQQEAQEEQQGVQEEEDSQEDYMPEAA